MQLKSQKKITLNGKKMRVGIVSARFNEKITNGLTRSALAGLKECGVKEKNICVVSVPGAMEIPYTLQKLAASKKYDCLVAIGCVIRGETPHFDYVCKMAQEGILRVSQDYKLPIGFGILTLENVGQAAERLHLGSDAVKAAVELALLK